MEWINVKDKLPYKEPSGCQVTRTLICAQGNAVGSCFFSYKKLDDKWVPEFRFKDFIVISDDEITHWQEFPEPPNEVPPKREQ